MVIPNKRPTTTLGAKRAPALRVAAKKPPSALLVVHLESPNFSPRALMGGFLAATGVMQVV
ncbi:MAG: hypothetical protein FH757_06050 [Alcanivorax sp.]|nr:hypothetical protein [Alcanivorax sp.]